MNEGKGGHDFQAKEKGKRAKIKVKAKTPTKEKIFSNWALIFTIDNCHLGQTLEDMHLIPCWLIQCLSDTHSHHWFTRSLGQPPSWQDPSWGQLSLLEATHRVDTLWYWSYWISISLSPAAPCFFLAHAVHARGSDGHQNVLWSISYSHFVREQVKSKKPDVFQSRNKTNPKHKHNPNKKQQRKTPRNLSRFQKNTILGALSTSSWWHSNSRK